MEPSIQIFIEQPPCTSPWLLLSRLSVPVLLGWSPRFSCRPQQGWRQSKLAETLACPGLLWHSGGDLVAESHSGKPPGSGPTASTRDKMSWNQTTRPKETARGQAIHPASCEISEQMSAEAPGIVRSASMGASPGKSRGAENRILDLLPYCQEDTGNCLKCPDGLLEKSGRERTSERLDIYPQTDCSLGRIRWI